MPEIVFKGKEYVYNHHLTVPYRPLVADAEKGVGAPDLAGNLVVHGDNLHALKSLLPRHAGAVDLVFIDPPYNTGNEGWCYSDGVNSPIMKEWLSSNPVDSEDMLRHDKWLCMMWPRLVLLRELLSERGSIWITLDDNEVHRARMALDEIFGGDNFVATVIWHKSDSPKNTAEYFSQDHDYVLVYAKSKESWELNLLPRSDEMLARYKNPDNDPRGAWMVSDLDARNYYSKGTYSIVTPAGRTIEGPPQGRYWSVSKERFEELDKDGRIWWGPDGRADPNIKRFLSEVKQGVVPQTMWHWSDVGSTRHSKTELVRMFSDRSTDDIFVTPKPTALIERIVQIGASPDAIVLDSFAGSGTTAHAVLKANAADGGTRRFILVEGEDYADRLTAERVRRAIKGYAWVGTQREPLLEQKITFTQFKKADHWLAQVEAIKAREGFADGDLAEQGTRKEKRFDRIAVKLDDGVLRVEGEKKISKRVEGLGGGFTYCTLGEPLDLDKLLSGESLPAFDALGEWLFHTATGGTLPPRPKKRPEWYLGEATDAHVWLVYRPELAFLTSPDAALTLSRAKELQTWGREHDAERGQPKRHLVFAPAKYLSNRQLAEHGIDYAPLPFALYREA
ncbi:site-specific DNA-methyltransferase [Luteimonas sp BLCC-B24]|uniref:site-specific DNA-methyltransferase n=1 Tax=Luteimonas sp. BLCC-B24 TaxID=3025317 RepID=UPI00234E2F1B|nr:site-specific DNA-methyltransferase [Luteimonas sp. BLCC-B24]MDC7808115.1 site-specific DNA-methyltransferase [Luteimonas sp. BLCC-B24]